MKVYSEVLNQEFDTEELEKVMGTVEHEGKILYLTQQAYADNYQDGVAYHANAIDKEGNTYKVIWLTTDEWDMAVEYENLKNYIDNAKRYGEEVSQDDLDRFNELDQMDMIDVCDESNACDWDKPYSITQI